MEAIHAKAWLPYQPAILLDLLMNQSTLTQIMGRVRRIEQLSDDTAQITLNVPMFGTFNTTGQVRQVDDYTVIFAMNDPFPLSFEWQLLPHEGGTQLDITISSDYKPLSMPMARDAVKSVIAKDIEGDVNRLAQLAAEQEAEITAA